MKLGALIGTTGVTALTIPSSTTSDTYFNATQQLEDAHINYKHFLIGTRAGSRVPDYVGPRLADKWDTMGELYKVFILIWTSPETNVSFVKFETLSISCQLKLEAHIIYPVRSVSARQSSLVYY